ncbi:RidA family protein [Pseudomonas sp. BN414]|uniref:RidA family protein n=1 Tax=Pseudomonas sp. BN414 TaxID=2567888 RepID=UPI002456118F|nr:RidA family protein [Pseudomonas sp. BN414]MDH4566887.1 RidA family protein [Pseudomonas sp. BN414]
MSDASCIYERIAAAGIKLNPPGKPVAAYVPFVESGKLLFLSGHIAKQAGQPWVGQLGRDMDTATGVGAARAIAVDVLGTLQAATGDLNRIARILKVLCLVNSSAEYREHHIVANGFSETLEEIFGDAGKHARSAFGVAQIPSGACVEVELIAELR